MHNVVMDNFSMEVDVIDVVNMQDNAENVNLKTTQSYVKLVILGQEAVSKKLPALAFQVINKLVDMRDIRCYIIILY